MAVFIFPAISVDTTGLATEAKQDTIITELQDSNTTLTSLDGKDFATETTLGTRASESTLAALNAKVTTADTDDVTVTSSALPTGAATETTVATLATESSLSAQAADIALLESRLAGSLVPEEFDYQELTYVAAGNGAGEVETVTYKTGGSGGSTVATLTLAYDAQNRVSSVTRS